MPKPAVLEEYTPAEWLDLALGVIAMYAERREAFTAEDIRHHLDEQPHHANAWGAAFRTAQAKGLITPTGYTNSHTRSRRNGVHRVWVGITRTHRENH